MGEDPKEHSSEEYYAIELPDVLIAILKTIGKWGKVAIGIIITLLLAWLIYWFCWGFRTTYAFSCTITDTTSDMLTTRLDSGETWRFNTPVLNDKISRFEVTDIYKTTASGSD